MVTYNEDILFDKEELANLFTNINWNSGKYPQKLFDSIVGSTYKIFAYSNDKLIGLATALSDGSINLFISYLVVNQDYQNQMIGSTLISKIVNGKKYNRIMLITDKDKLHKSFYCNQGFTEDGIGMFLIDWDK